MDGTHSTHEEDEKCLQNFNLKTQREEAVGNTDISLDGDLIL
jgi:hypothetical protein